MSTQGAAAQQGRVRRAVGWARKAPGKRVGGPVAAVALAISGAFGGWNAVDHTQEYDDLKVDQVVETGPFDLSVLRVRAIDHLKPLARPAEGNRFLVVVMKVRNTTDEPVYSTFLSGEVGVQVTGANVADVRPVVRRMNDLDFVGQFQPDITYEVGLFYETAGDDVATEVEVAVPQFTWREDSFTPGYFDWRDPHIVAEGAFPVKDVPDVPEETS